MTSNPAKIRERLGLTQIQLASLLRLGSDGRKTVERWERDGRAPGTAGLALEALASGWRPLGVQVTIALTKMPALRPNMTDDQVIEALAKATDATIRRGDSVRIFEGAECREFLAVERERLAAYIRDKVSA